MITKELKAKKYCCFYASDFHLEMILLPYLKDNLRKTNISILTQDSLSVSIKQVLDRTNFSEVEKEDIINLNWNEKQINKLRNSSFFGRYSNISFWISRIWCK